MSGPTKATLFAEFAAVGKALGHPKRLELLDLLSQGPRSVDDLATCTEVGVSTCSAHLQSLREAGLVISRRDGKRIFYALAGDDVAALWERLRLVAQHHRPHTDVARRAYLGPDDAEAIDLGELCRRLDLEEIVVIDVRPELEYAAAHLPGAINLPLEELLERLDELPPEREIVAYCRGRYCVLSRDAVRLLNQQGRQARWAADGALEWRVAGVLTS